MSILASDERFIRKPAVAFLVEMLLVVVSCHIQGIQKSQPGGQFGKGSRQGDRTCRVNLFYDFCEPPGQYSQASGIRPFGIILPFLCRFIRIVVAGHGGEGRVAVRVIGVVDLVADTPHDNGRMAAVPAYQVRQVLFVPPGEIQVVPLMLWRIHIMSCAPLVFWPLPFVESLIYNKKSHGITQVIKLRHMGIVAHADGVAAHIFQFFQTPFPHGYGYSGAQAARVVVNTDAFYQHVFVIQEKACIRIKTDAADADPAAVSHVLFAAAGFAGNIVCRAEPGFQGI